MNRIQSATANILAAFDKLRRARQDLLYARNDQHERLANVLNELNEIFGILTDPECTPEIRDRMIDLNIKVEPVTDIDFIVDRINKSISEAFERKTQD